jgi:hypothetical protein
MMELSYCGLACESCPIHVATLEKDVDLRDEMRRAIARQINDHYGGNLNASDINDCDGCQSKTGFLFNGCYRCGIRKCCMERGLRNCAFCDEYACEMLLEFLQKEPGAKIRLEQIRNQTQNNS